MDSELLTMLGIDIDPAYIFIGLAAAVLLLFILLIVALAKISGLKKRYNYFMKGENGKSLEISMKNKFDQLEELDRRSKVNEQNIKKIFDNLNIAIQKFGMVKYDAFDEMGGKLSFSLALLDKKNNGIVLNAVHTREGCYTYIKDIIDGASVLLLTNEEQHAIDIAMNGEGNEK
ncbi:MAG: DUF4446 family protein [Eubacterium sp.]|nr:DUF4446 family protein [Eubacterium sp.]